DHDGDRSPVPLQRLETLLHGAGPRRTDRAEGQDQRSRYGWMAEGPPSEGEVHADCVHISSGRHLLPGHPGHSAGSALSQDLTATSDARVPSRSSSLTIAFDPARPVRTGSFDP